MAKKPVPGGDTPPLHTPFAGLDGLRAKLPPGAPPPPTEAPRPQAPARAVVRYERKGHGGKEMTRVEQLGLRPADLERWLKEAKQALGCGGAVEGDALLLQGDQRDRLRAWLERRGVGRVTVS